MISKNELDEFHHLYEHNLKDKATKMLRTKINVNDECFLDEHMKGNLLTYVLISDERSGLIYDWIDLLLDNGADINLVDENHYPPIYYALFHETSSVFDYLVAKGANIDFKVDEHTHFVESILLHNKDKLSWVAPFYTQIDWTHINDGIHEEMRLYSIYIELQKYVEQKEQAQQKINEQYKQFLNLYTHNLKLDAMKMIRDGLALNEFLVINQTSLERITLLNALIIHHYHEHVYDWIDLLLDNGANIDLGQDNKQSVIHKALEGNNKMMFNYLMNKRVKLNLTELISVSPYFVDWLKEQRRLDWFYPWYDKFDWTHMDKTISEEIKKGYDIFKFKEKLEQELIETDKKIIKI